MVLASATHILKILKLILVSTQTGSVFVAYLKDIFVSLRKAQMAIGNRRSK